VNALADKFEISSFREGTGRKATFERGELIDESKIPQTEERNGTYVHFRPDETIFKNFRYKAEFIERLIRNYCYLNTGLSLWFNGERFHSKHGLKDLLEEKMSDEPLYPIIHIDGPDIEVALTHTASYGEEYYSFVNGQHTTQGGTHQSAFREAYARVVKEFFGKNYEPTDIRASLIAAVSVKVIEPVFESQTKTKLGSTEIEPDGKSMRAFIGDFLKEKLDNYLHKHPDVAEALERKIKLNEKERKDLAGIRKLARERAKKANLHNKKLRDCRVHYNDSKPHERASETMIFITEGDSAAGSITKSRDVNTQAVFSLKGKPLNSYGLTKKIVYENEELNLIQAALNIEDGMEGLRYSKIVIATDADVDGMHIRLLLMTFFLQFFPDLIRNNHLYILQTPLFRVRNKKKTYYCYSEQERRDATVKVGKNSEITRFKGLGEISPDEFKNFIGDDIRLEPVVISKDFTITELLSFYMGKNTPERQGFIIDNLRVEKDPVAEMESGTDTSTEAEDEVASEKELAD
jgi:topoisomerase-4 subunit B